MSDFAMMWMASSFTTATIIAVLQRSAINVDRDDVVVGLVLVLLGPAGLALVVISLMAMWSDRQ